MIGDNNEQRAFPMISPFSTPEDRGMTLRDWFAGQAMNTVWPTVMIHRKYFDDDAYECAVLAYKLADAMMEARKK